MKRNSIRICALAALAIATPVFLSTGCGKSEKSKSGKPAAAETSTAKGKGKGKKAAKPAASTQDTHGESSVAFYNSFIRFRGTSQSVFEKVAEALEKSEKAVENINGVDRSIWNSVIPANSQIEKIPGYEYAAPGDFAQKDKDYINPRIEAVKGDVAALLKEIETLKTYYKAEDFKDDWHKKFLMAKPRIESLMRQINKANKEVLKLADALSEETDRKNVAKAPDGVFILNMRYIIDKAKDRADLILDNDFEDTRYGHGVTEDERRQMVARSAPICDKFDALTKEIEALCAKYKGADKKVIQGSSAEKIYDGFFASYEKSEADLRAIVRELRDNGYTNNQQTLASSVGTLIKAHNDFLKSRQGK